jgi:alkyldihydroxyacetonephosphate synthase
MIAYIRDYAMNFYFMAESFETSVPWENVDALIRNTSAVIEQACVDNGVSKKPFVSSRVTQVYDTGACVYVYFGFFYKNLADPIKTYTDIETAARLEILRCGGSLSHHHGIGKLRKGMITDAIAPTGVAMLKAMKHAIDPQNIFAAGNLF